MGWNSYDYYDTTVTEERVKANADYMAAHLKAYGWEYIVVDIEWFAHRAGSMRDQYQYIPFNELEMDAYGRLFPDPERFPSSADGAGFKPLADYVHSLGLKFGIHIMRGIPRAAAHDHLPVYGVSAGTQKPLPAADTGAAVKKSMPEEDTNMSAQDFRTISGTGVTAADVADPSSICRWNPDMYGLRADRKESQAYYDSIFDLYAQWGIDYVKCDDICNTNAYPTNPYSAAHEIEMIHAAIQKCGRPMVLSLSPGPALIEHAWHYEKYANMWRITDDFWDEWPLLLNMFERCELWQNHVSPGCFPDCDMLPLGSLGKGFGHEWQSRFTKPEQITMMTLWCMFRSPLMLGAEMTKLDDWTLSLLTNREALSLLQDGRHGVQVLRTKDCVVWGNYREKSPDVRLEPGTVDLAGTANAPGMTLGMSIEKNPEMPMEKAPGTSMEMNPGRHMKIASETPTERLPEALTAESDLYVALFNLKETGAEVSVAIEELADSLPAVLFFFAEAEPLTARSVWELREVWTGEVLKCDGGRISATVEGHGAKLYQIRSLQSIS